VTQEPALAGLPRWGFGSPGSQREQLTRLALAGIKTATTGLLAGYAIDGSTVPRVGERQVIVDSGGRSVAVAETTSATVMRLAEVDDAHAVDEGEYADAAEYRVAHERWWAGMLDDIRDALGDPSFAVTGDTPVVAERFRVVEVLGLPSGSPLVVRPAMPADRPVLDGFLGAHDAALVARRGELVDARKHPALIAELDGSLVGAATWIAADDAIELLTLHALVPWQGTGSALIAAARTVARAVGATRVWLITTNDNLEALRFYQRRGLRLVGVDAGAVDRCRASLKPGIPEVGLFGIPIRDELELVLDIPQGERP
jgi:uncharacterized protein YhfF/N-acetylglutamate synthase-like GNAT family acetyltransferase